MEATNKLEMNCSVLSVAKLWNKVTIPLYITTMYKSNLNCHLGLSICLLSRPQAAIALYLTAVRRSQWLRSAKEEQKELHYTGPITVSLYSENILNINSI